MFRKYLDPGVVIVVIILLFSSLAIADVLTIPEIGNQPSNSSEGVIRPSRGMTMDEVTAQFGKPKQIMAPVGDPPITRWVYDKFTVHFEYNYVIHSVVHRN